ncbi:saccharopine dehydrogenase family protein [Arenicella sp. 4NH20-0111]|uniref:saccharopine dehydrogenase family protein n=1 Tax=Arenicella sp. 4NH20-0111 TaxID=3127648 RepID=UPI00310A8D41
MKEIILLGSGKIGAIITELLSTCGDYHVTVADMSEENLGKLNTNDNVSTLQLDVTDEDALANAMKGKFAALSACPFHITKFVAMAAAKAGVHYFDLTEDVACTNLVKGLAKDAKAALMPQCGLAPGFITIAAYDLCKEFDELHNVHMRVGALPKYPSNGLKYNLTWSTDGLINEYCNPCEAIVDGRLMQVPALEELEEFSLDGVMYEAFNTSGGLGTLCETLEGKVHNLNYRTVRYPGHRDIMKMLLQDLRFKDNREQLKDIFENALPLTYQDVVLVFINVSGIKNGQLVQESYANKVYNETINGKLWSAIQVTTASGICGVLDLMAEGKLPQQGFVRQEDVLFDDFINNRFGQYYQRHKDKQETL